MKKTIPAFFSSIYIMSESVRLGSVPKSAPSRFLEPVRSVRLAPARSACRAEANRLSRSPSLVRMQNIYLILEKLRSPGLITNIVQVTQ